MECPFSLTELVMSTKMKFTNRIDKIYEEMSYSLA